VTYFGYLSGDAETAIRVLKMMHHRHDGFISDYPYSVTIQACNEWRRWEDAVEVYELFKQTRFNCTYHLVKYAQWLLKL